MDIIKKIEEKYGEIRISGSEVKVKTCPYCGSTKYKFSINVNKGVYKCWRGSCGEKGSLKKLFPEYNAVEVKKVNFTKSLLGDI